MVTNFLYQYLKYFPELNIYFALRNYNNTFATRNQLKQGACSGVNSACGEEDRQNAWHTYCETAQAGVNIKVAIIFILILKYLV